MSQEMYHQAKDGTTFSTLSEDEGLKLHNLRAGNVGIIENAHDDGYDNLKKEFPADIDEAKLDNVKGKPVQIDESKKGAGHDSMTVVQRMNKRRYGRKMDQI
jgi:hypothetical protein